MRYSQRILDAGTGGYCYYTKTFLDPAPLASETSPNYTGAISEHALLAVLPPPLANEVLYTPAVPTDWPVVPTEVAAALDELAPSATAAYRKLILFIDSGPAEGYASGAYCETLPSDSVFPTSTIWWESSAKLKKIVSLDVTWNGALPTTEEWKLYAADGTTVLLTATDAIVYAGVIETSRTRTLV